MSDRLSGLVGGPDPDAARLWTESFRVRAYEAGPDARASILTLCDYCQEGACNHANALGIERLALPSGLATWVLHRLRLEVERFPTWREPVTLETWPSDVDGLRGYREFLLREEQGATLARGTSVWSVVDIARRRPVRIPAEARAVHRLDRPLALDHGASEPVPPEVPVSERLFDVRWADLDPNGHTNHVRFVEWALEAVPDPFQRSHRPAALDAVFRGEAFYGDTVASSAGPSGPLAWAHRLTRAADGRELALLRTRWVAAIGGQDGSRTEGNEKGDGAEGPVPLETGEPA